jgi:hypothetical protein
MVLLARELAQSRRKSGGGVERLVGEEEASSFWWATGCLKTQTIHRSVQAAHRIVGRWYISWFVRRDW